MLKQLLNESDYAVKMFSEQRYKRPDDSAECGYKIIVATVLPRLYLQLRLLLILFGGIFGLLATLLVLALVKG